MLDKATTLTDLLAVKLLGLCAAEQQLVKALPKLAAKATDPRLRLGFENHLVETKNHILRLVAGGAQPRPRRPRLPSDGCDPNIALLWVNIENGGYWNEPGNVFVRAYAYAKAVTTGEKHQPTPEEQAKVQA